MTGDSKAPTQPDQAEGERDEPSAGKAAGQGIPSGDQAEGADDAPSRQPGSPQG